MAFLIVNTAYSSTVGADLCVRPFLDFERDDTQVVPYKMAQQ